MKKIMIAFAAVVMTVVANAATCSWTGSAIALSKSVGAASSATGYTMYLIDAATTSVADMTKALNSSDLSKLDSAVMTTSGIAVGTTAARWSATGWGSYDAGNSYTYYTVILNNSADKADQYMITKEVTAKVPTSGNLTMSFGTQAQNSWNNVPEPTSAMLLLLGVAGLALRRKQK